MTKFLSELRVLPGQKVDLQANETDKVYGLDEKDIRKKTKDLYKSLLELQQQLYAGKEQSLLIVLQAMDAAGKDSTIRKLTTQLNVQGCRVKSFGKPTKHELAHDFLWRVHSQAPAKGEMVLFNRSHYEDVLIVKVHGWQSPEIIERRYQHINQFEALLADSGTKVLKFMLNVSPDYQLSRFKSRLENPEKNWKFNPGDLDERRHWDDYMQAFNTALSQCSTEQAPWYVIPAEQRWFRDYAIARIVHDTLVDMKPEYPEPDFDAELFTADSIE
ncbi:MAG: PPK2 family polyphosphate kinase [Arenicella sp.]